MIHTAFDAGNVGPDYTYGWGLINAAAAANLLTDAFTSAHAHSAVLEEAYIGLERFFEVSSDGTGPLKVTMVWNDPAPSVLPGESLDDPASVLVHDLDLWVSGPGGTYWPWRLTISNPSAPATRSGLNHIDNIEQVLIDSPLAGLYTLHVGRTGITFDQDFSLLMSGGELVPEPATLCLLLLGGLAAMARRRRT